MAKIQLKRSSGTTFIGKASKNSLKHLLDMYRLSNEVEGKSPKTVGWYNEMLRLFTRYLVTKPAASNIEAFSIDLVKDYILYLRQKRRFKGHPYTPEQDSRLSVKTIQCHVRALKAFSSWLYSEGYTTENRLRNLKLPKAPVTMIEPLTPDEINNIITSINKTYSSGARNHAIFVTLLDTGLRASEAVGITLGNLNLDDGFVKVMGKGAKERIVPVGKHVRMVLFSYIEKTRPQVASSACDNLFLSSTGKPITANTLKLVFSRLARTSGVKRLHAHLCRHTFATNYLLNGGDIFSLKEILGHTTFEMVNHYLHFTSSQITSQHHKYSPMDKLYGKGTWPITKSPASVGP
jgi:site-specific recombinase XerD